MLKYIQKTVYTTYPLILPEVRCHLQKVSHQPALVAKWGHLPSSTDNLKQQASTFEFYKLPLVHWESTWVLSDELVVFHKPTHLKNMGQIGSSPQGEGVNMNNIWKLPPYGETTYNKHLNGLTSPDFVQVWGWFHMVGWPQKNLPNLYRLWTRNLETNLCRWLGFVAVYYFIHDLSKFWNLRKTSLKTPLMMKTKSKVGNESLMIKTPPKI